jgi:glycosyltransferase involved in cell wall biosynthesis
VKGTPGLRHEWIDAADTAIFLRQVETSDYAWFRYCKESRKKTIYVIDDNFLAIPAETPIGQYFARTDIQSTFVQFLREADTIVVGSPFFGYYIKANFNPNVVCIPASVDFGVIDRMLPPLAPTNGPIVIGYAGSQREDDFAEVVPALQRLLAEYDSRIRLEFFGFVPQALAGHPLVTMHHGCDNYIEFLTRFAGLGWHIGLAPLRHSLFNYCKTNNKFREYAACRIAGVYTNLPVYADWVTDRKTGLLVDHNPAAWYEGIKLLIDNPELRLRIQEEAGQYTRTQFTIEQNASAWHELVNTR